MLVLSDRIKQTSITTGSGTITLADTYGGFQSFANGIGEGNTTYYTIENGTKYEVGIGTYISNTLSRDLVLDSSNNNNKIDLEGVSIVFCTYPADYSFFLNQKGYASGQMPHYSGIAFPDGTIQQTAAISSFYGSENSVTYWSQDDTLSYIGEITWDNISSGLLVNADVVIGQDLSVSGQINAKETWFVRDSAGCFFHGYIDNVYDKMVVLYSDNTTSPTWRLGVKNYSTDFTTPPSYGYVQGTNGSVSLIPDSSNELNISHNNGFVVNNKNVNTLTSSADDGTVVYNNVASTTAFTVKGASAQSANLQEWTDYSDSVLASINPSGQINIASIKFPDNTIQSTAFRAGEVIYKTITSSTYLDPLDDVIFVDCSSNIVNVTLPTASGVGGKKIIIKRKSGGLYNLSIIASGSEELDGASNFDMFYDNQSVTVISDNSNWFII